MRPLGPCLLLCLVLAGCSGDTATPRKSNLYAAGDKATAGNLTYSVIDCEYQTRLGEDANPRIPHNRFVTVQLAISNSGNTDAPVPGLALIDDAGKVYPELGDGSGVPEWLGVLRKVGPGQTTRGTVVFDAPAGHYKLRLNDELSDTDVYSDIPLSFIHEQMNGIGSAADAPAPAPATEK